MVWRVVLWCNVCVSVLTGGTDGSAGKGWVTVRQLGGGPVEPASAAHPLPGWLPVTQLQAMYRERFMEAMQDADTYYKLVEAIYGSQPVQPSACRDAAVLGAAGRAPAGEVAAATEQEAAAAEQEAAAAEREAAQLEQELAAAREAAAQLEAQLDQARARQRQAQERAEERRRQQQQQQQQLQHEEQT